MIKHRLVAGLLMSSVLTLGTLAIPGAASANANPCVSTFHLTQNVPSGGVGGGYIQIGTMDYWAGNFIIDHNHSQADLVADFSTTQVTDSSGNHLAYVNWVNPYSSSIIWEGWINIIHSC